jgi:preprotein translocase subunit SecF
MKNLEILNYRKFGFIFSAAILLILLATFFFNGLTLDITFKGGTRMTFEATEHIDLSAAAALGKQTVGKEVTASIMETYNAENTADKVEMLRLDVAGSEPLTDAESIALREAVAGAFPVDLDSSRNETVSITPSIGRETLEKGLLAVIVSSVLILFYVAWRFAIMSGFSAAFTAVLALIHDAGIIFGIYIAFRLPLNEGFIAALLTVIGYSINDTIIMYDRIRENSTLMRKHPLAEIVNVSVRQTLARSINTTVTTLICLMALYAFSAANNIQSLKDFSLTLSIGMIAGTYSSMFLAIPLWFEIRQRKLQHKLQAAAN